MSRRRQSTPKLTRTPFILMNLITACCVAGLVLAGCGAGQVTQTDSQVAVIEGADRDIGNIALRDVLVPYPDASHGSYPVGSDVPLQFTLVNQGASADELVSVSSPIASRVLVEGETTMPAGLSITSPRQARDSASPTPSLQPASPVDFGELRIVFVDITRVLRPGLNTEVTFVFRNAGSLTMPVPMGLPVDSERKPLDEGEHS